MKLVEKLYECRVCGGLVATKAVACPYCEESDGGTQTVVDLRTGEPAEKPKPLFEAVELAGVVR